jgi:hypothetical protein
MNDAQIGHNADAEAWASQPACTSLPYYLGTAVRALATVALSFGSSMTAHDSKLMRIIGLALFLLVTRDAFSDDTMNIRVYNDTSDEIVYDMNATPSGPALERQTIDGFAWFPALVTPGFEGSGHVRWSAETTSTSFHRCGHAERWGLTDDAMLHVFTDSDC